MDAKPPKTHHAAFNSLRIPGSVAVGIGSYVSGIASFALLFYAFLYCRPDSWIALNWFSSEHYAQNMAIGMISSGVAFLIGGYLFAQGIAALGIAENFRKKDRSRGYHYE